MRKWVLSSFEMLDRFMDDVRETAAGCLKDGVVMIQVQPKKESRSDQQNSLYRVWCRYFAEHSNRYMSVWDDELLVYAEQRMDEDAWHDLFRYAYLPSRLAKVPTDYSTDKPVTILQSTTRLTVQQMNEYMQRIEALAGRMGMKLPIPDGPYREFRDAA